QFFDAVDTASACLKMFAGILATARVKDQRTREAAAGGFSTATDIADYLVRKGLPFRKAHEVVGRLVRHCLDRACRFEDLTLDEIRSFSPEFDEDVLTIDVQASVNARDVPGGTAPNRVRDAIAEGRRLLAATETWLASLP
ncbi:MAG TPA: argininosuccinate lyase, partial [Chloroflexota bacterium]|nr:argininosuccinate lyase [Chloroflexota bacterium]